MKIWNILKFKMQTWLHCCKSIAASVAADAGLQQAQKPRALFWNLSNAFSFSRILFVHKKVSIVLFDILLVVTFSDFMFLYVCPFWKYKKKVLRCKLDFVVAKVSQQEFACQTLVCNRRQSQELLNSIKKADNWIILIKIWKLFKFWNGNLTSLLQKCRSKSGCQMLVCNRRKSQELPFEIYQMHFLLQEFFLYTEVSGGHLLRFYVLVCVPFCNFWFCPIPFIRFFPATIFSFSFALTQPHLLSGSSWKQMRQGQYWSTDYECAKSDLMDYASYIWSGVNSMIASGSVSSWHGQPCGLQLFKGEQF